MSLPEMSDEDKSGDSKTKIIKASSDESVEDKSNRPISYSDKSVEDKSSNNPKGATHKFIENEWNKPGGSSDKFNENESNNNINMELDKPVEGKSVTFKNKRASSEIDKVVETKLVHEVSTEVPSKNTASATYSDEGMLITSVSTDSTSKGRRYVEKMESLTSAVRCTIRSPNSVSLKPSMSE